VTIHVLGIDLAENLFQLHGVARLSPWSPSAASSCSASGSRSRGAGSCDGAACATMPLSPRAARRARRGASGALELRDRRGEQGAAATPAPQATRVRRHIPTLEDVAPCALPSVIEQRTVYKAFSRRSPNQRVNSRGENRLSETVFGSAPTERGEQPPARNGGISGLPRAGR
jgi:hypothetical protein